MDVGKYATQSAFTMHPGLVETREQSLLGTLDMHEKWHGKANDRLRKYLHVTLCLIRTKIHLPIRCLVWFSHSGRS
jgi:hypothetical protein